MFGFECAEVQNGEECVDYVKKLNNKASCSCPGLRLIFMDVQMPIIDGVKATK